MICCGDLVEMEKRFNYTLDLFHELRGYNYKELDVDIYVKDIMQTEVTTVPSTSTVEQSETIMLNT